VKLTFQWLSRLLPPHWPLGQKNRIISFGAIVSRLDVSGGLAWLQTYALFRQDWNSHKEQDGRLRRRPNFYRPNLPLARGSFLNKQLTNSMGSSSKGYTGYTLILRCISMVWRSRNAPQNTFASTFFKHFTT